MITIVIYILSILVLVSYFTLKWKYSYWKRRNVPHPPPALIVGNYGNLLLVKMTMGEISQNICKQFPKEPYIGTYFGTEPALLVQDPELIKLITTKDFYYFNSREIAKYSKSELSTQSLFFNHGETWKVVRQSMTPLFTPVKMKNMFHLIKTCIKNFDKMLARETKISQEIDTISIMARFTMDCIVTTAFGVEANTLEDTKDENLFTKAGDMLFEVSYSRLWSLTVRSIWPAVFYGLGFQVFPKKMSQFFSQLLIGVFKDRNFKPSNRNDFIDIVLRLKESDYITCDNWSQAKGKKTIELKVDDELLISQCQVIFAAGYETSATTASYVLFELAKNQQAQKKVLEEIDAHMQKYGQDLEYEHLSQLPFVEACIDETLRLYPVLGTLTREVVEDYTLPSGLHLEKGLRVHLPILHLHRHPDYFPEPDRFCPERFLQDQKQEIKPYTYMPFGEGGRICIGLRFGKILTMSAVVTSLMRYRVELADGMPLEPKVEPRAFVTRPVQGIQLKLIARK